MKAYSLIFMLIAYCVAYSQTSEAILEKVTDQYSSSIPLQYSTSYNLYKSHDSNIVKETYKGQFYSNGKKSSYLKINNTEFITGGIYSLRINHEFKQIIVARSSVNQPIQFDYNQLKKAFKAESMKDKGNHWIIELNSKVGNSEFSKILLHIDKSYLIRKQIFFYNTKLTFSKRQAESEISTPRLEIVFTNVNRKEATIDTFNISKYIAIENGKIKAAGKHKSYKITVN